MDPYSAYHRSEVTRRLQEVSRGCRTRVFHTTMESETTVGGLRCTSCPPRLTSMVCDLKRPAVQLSPDQVCCLLPPTTKPHSNEPGLGAMQRIATAKNMQYVSLYRPLRVMTVSELVTVAHIDPSDLSQGVRYQLAADASLCNLSNNG